MAHAPNNGQARPKGAQSPGGEVALLKIRWCFAMKVICQVVNYTKLILSTGNKCVFHSEVENNNVSESISGQNEISGKAKQMS